MPVQVDPVASDDLEDILKQVMKLSPNKARWLQEEFMRVMESVGDTPGLGKAKLEGRPYLFKLVDDRYYVIYNDVPTGELVTILRIKRTTDDLEAALENLPE